MPPGCRPNWSPGCVSAASAAWGKAPGDRRFLPSLAMPQQAADLAADVERQFSAARLSAIVAAPANRGATVEIDVGRETRESWAGHPSLALGLAARWRATDTRRVRRGTHATDAIWRLLFRCACASDRQRMFRRPAVVA